MKKVTIEFRKCGASKKPDCPYVRIDEFADVGRGLIYCARTDDPLKAVEAYQQNKDGITPSCPMYASSVEVAE